MDRQKRCRAFTMNGECEDVAPIFVRDPINYFYSLMVQILLGLFGRRVF